MILRQTLPEAVNGYWDSGMKQVFDWELGIVRHDDKGYYVKVGSFSANYWFHVAQGKTDRQTLSYVMRYLKKTSIGKASKFEYIVD
jgi:hypothetical protein